MKIVYEKAGGVCVVTPVEGSRLVSAITKDGVRTEYPSVPADMVYRGWPVTGAVAEWAETEEQWLDRIRVLAVPERTQATVVEDSKVPTDRTFRNAWGLDPSGVAVDMKKAVEIHKEKIRQERAPLLAALDIEFSRATGNVAAQAVIEAKRQALRDATDFDGIGKAKTPEELKAAIPPALRK